MSEKQAPVILDYANSPEIRLPGVVKWYRIFVVITGLIYVSISLTYIIYYLTGRRHPPEEYLIMSLMIPLACIGVILVWSARWPRERWAWYCSILMIIFCMFNACSILAGILLICFWCRYDCRAWYNLVPARTIDFLSRTGGTDGTNRFVPGSVFMLHGMPGQTQTLPGDDRSDHPPDRSA